MSAKDGGKVFAISGVEKKPLLFLMFERGTQDCLNFLKMVDAYEDITGKNVQRVTANLTEEEIKRLVANGLNVFVAEEHVLRSRQH